MEPTTLSALLAPQRLRAPGALLLADASGAIDARDFEARIRRTAGWLRAQGIARGDRVGVWLVNRTEWLVLLFALARLGATLVSINTRFRASELAYLLARSKARLLVMQPAFRALDFPAILAGVDPAELPALERIAFLCKGERLPARLLDRPTVVFDEGRGEGGEEGEDADDDPDSLAILFTTSGTTRSPKLVMHSQRTLAGHAAQVARAHGLHEPGARLLGALPLCGTFGLTGVLAALAVGAPAVLMEGFDGEQAAQLIREQAITHLYGSDEMFRRILEAVPGHAPFPSARVFGFAAFQPGASEFAKAAWTRGVPMLGLYGSSEVQALFSIQRPDAPLDERIEGGGLPATAGAGVRVREIETGALAAPGVDGEIEIRASGNFVGYLDDPGATAAVVDGEGFFRTGDVGRLREDGSFVYLTRRGDAIRLGGFLVNPAEIEEALAGLDGVAEAAVIAAEIESKTRCVAFVVPQPGARLDEASLLAAARARMAAFKVPARVWSVEALPTTASANGTKVQRARLREMALERLAAAAGSRP